MRRQTEALSQSPKWFRLVIINTFLKKNKNSLAFSKQKFAICVIIYFFAFTVCYNIVPEAIKQT